MSALAAFPEPTMTPDKFKQLREPFKPEEIGKLPKLTCKACGESREKHCSTHQIIKCNKCNNRISSAHIDLDYVGHAATTNRLLNVDPSWTWRPFSREERADVEAQPGDLWIWLTICGVTRPGVGDGKNAKERIGDAIRNAAMRFGVALDLWSKEELEVPDEAGPPSTKGSGQSPSGTDEGAPTGSTPASSETPKGEEEAAPRRPSSPALSHKAAVEAFNKALDEKFGRRHTVRDAFVQPLLKRAEAPSIEKLDEQTLFEETKRLGGSS